jgi:hypothetical protein
MSASPEGIGPVWQRTAVDTATRYAIGALVAGDKSAGDAASFVDHVAERLAGIGAELTGYGPTTARSSPAVGSPAISRSLASLTTGSRPARPTTTRSANASRHRLQEFYRPAFHRQHFARLADLNAQFQGWLQTYSTRRRNHGASCAAARPLRSWRPPIMTKPRVHRSPQPVLRKP